MEEFRPLAVIMSVATVYLLTSSLTALGYKKRFSRIVTTAIIILPFLLFVASSRQFIRVLPEISLATFTPLLLALTFATLIFRDIKLLKKIVLPSICFFLKRHAFGMIPAFGFAVMAVFRIGIKVDLLGLEFTTFFPLVLSLIAAFHAERNIVKLLQYRK